VRIKTAHTFKNVFKRNNAKWVDVRIKTEKKLGRVIIGVY